MPQGRPFFSPESMSDKERILKRFTVEQLRVWYGSKVETLLEDCPAWFVRHMEKQHMYEGMTPAQRVAFDSGSTTEERKAKEEADFNARQLAAQSDQARKYCAPSQIVSLTSAEDVEIRLCRLRSDVNGLLIKSRAAEKKRLDDSCSAALLELGIKTKMVDGVLCSFGAPKAAPPSQSGAPV